MARDYRLYELSEAEFEALVVRVCTHWLGNGVTPFAPGKDGGRDGKFKGTAQSYPSTSEPIKGHCVLQAKHVQAPDKSCSDPDFKRLLDGEHTKIKRLVGEGICEHYLVFTNRKLTGGADEKLIKAFNALGLTSAHIIGVERLHLAIEQHQDVRDSLPNRDEVLPFRFDPNDLVEVISALHGYVKQDAAPAYESAIDFKVIKIKEEKNKINGLSKEYYEQIIVADSMPHFQKIESFLKNPRNRDFSDLYHDSADDLKAKILVSRAQFDSFDAVFNCLASELQKSAPQLKGKRKLARILLHYMYFNCDIGSKDKSELGEVADAFA